MKARRLPQDGIVLEVVENLQEIIWGKIAFGVKHHASCGQKEHEMVRY